MNTTTLNDGQQAAIHSDSPLILCLAGPGSGKTRTLVERVKRLILDGVNPREVVCISFTNAAAIELKSRLGFNVGFCGTLHAFLLTIIQEHWEELGYRSAKLTVIDSEQADEMLDRCASELKYRGPKKDVLAALNEKAVRTRQSLAQLVALKYVMELMANGLMSFDMILTEGLRLFDQDRFSLPFTHLFVDEVQDLTDIEYELCMKCPVQNRYLTGDPDQSIFGFKGGNVNHIIELAKEGM